MNHNSSEHESSNILAKSLTHNRHVRQIFASSTCFDSPKSKHMWITYENIGEKIPGCAWCRYLVYQNKFTSKPNFPNKVSRNQHCYSNCDVSLCTTAHFHVLHACPLVPPNQIVNRGDYQMTVICLIMIPMSLLVYLFE